LTPTALAGESPRVGAAKYVVYTDGGCRPNPGPGGWGAVIVTFGEKGERRRELSGGEAYSTNNRMELTAAVRALEALPDGSRVDLVTDSTYLKQGITRWLRAWRARGWKTVTGEPVKNQDLWGALDEAARRHLVTWRWARGHAGDEGNERAHQLAADAIPAAAPGRRRGGRAAEALGQAPSASRPARPADADTGEPPTEAVEAFVGIAWSARHREGTWGAVLRFKGHEKELSGKADVASPNAAHIASAVHALEAVRESRPVRLVTASDYLRDGAAQWLPAWRKRGWRTKGGEPVANREWWQRLERQQARLRVEWVVADKEAPPPELAQARELARAALSR
jgi:ribonuclease HI